MSESASVLHAVSDPSARRQDPLTLERLGPYTILEPLGGGAMARVYLAEQRTPIRRQVAIKVLRPTSTLHKAAQRMNAERQALARMNHPNIAKVFDAGETDDGRAFVVMEYVPGTPITEFCDRHRLDLDTRLRLFVQVCDGIHHAHQQGVLHRDIKPSNVLVSLMRHRPIPKIIDFGIAKGLDGSLTDHTMATGAVVLGTPAYMSPERIDPSVEKRAKIDTRADVYSLGVLLYELLIGVLPFGTSEDNFGRVVRRIMMEDPPSPSARLRELPATQQEATAVRRQTSADALTQALAPALDAVALGAVQRDRHARTVSAEALAQAVHGTLAPTLTTGGGTTPIVVRSTNRIVAAGALMLTLLLLGALVFTALGWRRAANANAEVAQYSRDLQSAQQRFRDWLLDAPALDLPEPISQRDRLDGALALTDHLVDRPGMRAAYLDMLGQALLDADRVDSAVQHLEEALELQRVTFGERHPATLATTVHLSEAMLRIGEPEPARDFADDVLHDPPPGLAPELLAAASRAQAASLWQLGARELAETRARANLAQQRVNASDDLQRLPELRMLVDMLVARAHYREAEALCLEMLDITRMRLGPRHHQTRAALRRLATVYEATGRSDEAAALRAQSARRPPDDAPGSASDDAPPRTVRPTTPDTP